MKQTIFFLAEFFRNRRLTGSMVPSSRFLAEALVQPLSCCPHPKQVVEIGPGTGPVTEHIVPHLRPGDRFVMVEANPRFCEILDDLCRNRFAKALDGVRIEIHCSLLEQVETAAGFDVAISGLPLNNFPVDVVRRILRSLDTLLSSTGTLSYFEYLGMRRILTQVRMICDRRPWSIRPSRVLDRFLDRHEVEEKTVLLNFPPAVVRHIRARRMPAENR